MRKMLLAILRVIHFAGFSLLMAFIHLAMLLLDAAVVIAYFVWFVRHHREPGVKSFWSFTGATLKQVVNGHLTLQTEAMELFEVR